MGYSDYQCLSVCPSVRPSTLLVIALSHQCIGGEKLYVTYICPLVCPKSLLKGSNYDEYFGVKLGKHLEIYFLLNAYVEKSNMLHNYACWGGLEAY